MMADKVFPRTMVEFEARFQTEAACRQFLFERRWPTGWRCPRCDAARGGPNRRGLVQCAHCGHQVSLTAGTLFHGTRKGLGLWFKAILLMMTQKNGVSARTLEQALGLSYPTAWTWLQKLRRAMAGRPCDPLTGRVALDDATVGGYRRGQPGRRKGGGNKTLILTAVERHTQTMGRARIRVVADHSGKAFAAMAAACVHKGSAVHTDGLYGFRQLRADYAHTATDVGSHTPRAVEALPAVHRVISLLKRWLLGTHQGAVSGKHLPAYLAEFEFRFNRRTATHRTLLFERVIDLAVRTAAPTYRALINTHCDTLQRVPT